LRTKLLETILAAVIVTVSCVPPAVSADGAVVIGTIDDLSGVYAEDGGPGSVEAMKMAIADFGGSVLGRSIETLVADHQNKPDIGASKLREWIDQKALNMLIAGANTGVSIAMTKVAASKKVPIFLIGAGGASLTNEDCTAYSIHYVYDTTALANGTATEVIKASGWGCCERPHQPLQRSALYR
jgi:branched-chain amino acid transport system substrate-binding protein